MWIAEKLRLCWTLFLYLKTLMFHKYAIFVSGMYINKKLQGSGFRVSFRRMILHDMSKFSSAELCPYTINFFGSEEEKENNNWAAALKHHFENNDHHTVQ
jgi:hypothetical protein